MNLKDQLDELAGSICDDRQVDWAHVSPPGRGSPATLKALREVARIATFNRELQRSPERIAAPAFAAAIPKSWGHLTLLEIVGAGAAGEVWRAWDPTLQREVALKFLVPGSVYEEGSRLLDEARALARVRHPGVVTVFGIADHDGRTGMWMELLRGATLADEIARRGALPVRDVARIGLDMAEALDAVFKAGLMHGDVKPQNIVIESDGRVVLTDFGLGRRRALAELDFRRQSGTPFFMSPALLSGGAAGPESDLYALGVSLRWALTGKPPFKARTIEDLLVEARNGPATPLAKERADAPRRLVAAIEKAMAPGGGVTNPAELAGAFRAALAELDSRAFFRQPRRLAAMAAVLSLILFGIWLAPRLSVTKAPQEPPPSGEPMTEVREPSGSTGAESKQSAGAESKLSPGAEGKPAGAPPEPTAAFEVQATFLASSGEEFRRLAQGDRVAPGDWLSLEFRATRPVWVYVLNQDELGETYLLFPQPLFDQSNPVSADSLVRLPGTVGGRQNAWRVTSRGGHENFLVVASPKPVDEFEQELKRLPEARPGRPIQYAAVERSTVERLRGVGGVSLAPADSSPQAARRSLDYFQTLAGRETVTQAIWIRRFTLENPIQ